MVSEPRTHFVARDKKQRMTPFTACDCHHRSGIPPRLPKVSHRSRDEEKNETWISTMNQNGHGSGTMSSGLSLIVVNTIPELWLVMVSFSPEHTAFA